MHYYKKNIGDYAKKAGRLSILQHGVYNLLLDACYDRESFPTRDEAIDWVWASTSEEIEAVEFVLRRFFDLQNDGKYVQHRISEELDLYRRKAETNKRIATERETKRKESRTKRARVVHEAPPNHKPITNNHKPITNKKIKTLVDSGESPSDDSTESLFDDFWTQYPRKEGKEAALKAFRRLKPNRDKTDTLIADIGRRLGAGAWVDVGPEKQYIPHASTYLNNGRWQDEIIPRGDAPPDYSAMARDVEIID